MESLETLTRLFGAMSTRPSNQGTRADKKVCAAQPGECRYNKKYYVFGFSGMNSPEAWDLHVADDSCQNRCPYLTI